MIRDRELVLAEATKTLTELLEEHQDQGFISVYLWGSIITPDFKPTTSDIDSIGFLSEEANFLELDKIRNWLPSKNPQLHRLQINFMYLSELTGEKPVRSRIARLATPAQAVYDFPYWHYVCGQKLDHAIFPEVSTLQFLEDQIKVVKERESWTINPKTENDTQYYCKSLVWLCWAIHKLKHQRSVFSWQVLQSEKTHETNKLVNILIELKESKWDNHAIDLALPDIFSESERLVKQIQRVHTY